jgi:hypothetical protein
MDCRCKQRTSFEHFFGTPSAEEQSSVRVMPPVSEREAKTVAARLMSEALRMQMEGFPEKTPSPETVAKAKGFREAAEWILEQWKGK